MPKGTQPLTSTHMGFKKTPDGPLNALKNKHDYEDTPSSLAERDKREKLIDPTRRRRLPRVLSMLEQIDAGTRDGTDIISTLVQAMNGDLPGVTPKDRIAVAQWLAERKWGKTPDTVVHAHAHALAAVPPEITSEVLTALARGKAVDLGLLTAPEYTEADYEPLEDHAKEEPTTTPEVEPVPSHADE